MATYRVAVGELPQFNTEFTVYATLGTNNEVPSNCSMPYRWHDIASGSGVNGVGSYNITTPTIGGNVRHNNVSPCLGAYLWKRTS